MTQDTFIRSISTWQESLRRFLLVLTHGNQALTDDVAQEAIIKAYLHCSSFRGDAELKTWVWKIAYNEYLNSQSSFWAQHSDSIDDTASVWEKYSSEATDRAFEYQSLYHAIDSLPAHERAVVLLYYMEELPIRDISRITHIKTSTITVTLFRARQHLKKILSRWVL